MDHTKRIRVLVAKVGLDGHEKGAILLSYRLRDAGMEVIYTGIRRTIDQVINTAMQEDVDVIGLSILSGAHLSICDKIIKKMKEKGLDDKLLIIGGVIPDEDLPKLTRMGVAGVFTQSSTFKEITEFIQEKAGKDKKGDAECQKQA